MVNTDIAIHDKTTGAVIAQSDLDGGGGFWATTNVVFDPYIVFDPDSDRFIAMGVDRTTAGPGSPVLPATSPPRFAGASVASSGLEFPAPWAAHRPPAQGCTAV